MRRYGPWTRANHWLTAACLILLLISGLGFFHPSLFFLTGLFGGGQTARFIHPWIGVVLFVSFLGLFFRMVRLNLPRPRGRDLARATPARSSPATRRRCPSSASTTPGRSSSSGR